MISVRPTRIPGTLHTGFISQQTLSECEGGGTAIQRQKKEFEKLREAMVLRELA
jgi:hypothetical protein